MLDDHPAPPASIDLRTARAEFAAETTYLDTAALGLPPRRTVTAVRDALATWQAGRAHAPGYDAAVTTARARYADLVGVSAAAVAVGSTVSAFAGLVAASLPDRSEVLTASGEFTSVLFPFLAQVSRGVRVREVPLEALADAVTPRTTLVAVSAVQSADGRLADLDALAAATATTGTEVLLDTTQAVGWLPVDAGRFTYTTGGGYKWLLGPRGTSFATVRPEALDRVVPHSAGWYAGADPWTSIYGSPLRLAPDARRFDLSPAWLSWVGQAPALELLQQVGREQLHAHAVGLANRFRAAVGLPPGNSAIVSAEVPPGTAEALAAAGVVAGMRAGRLRLAFHLPNTDADADLAAEVLNGRVR
ncbi:aminotransferase class V-fold PLP-dependent enzyme [Blastococcus sp. TF02-8]|uniref:aminotransferase class V-fold PLP-dependent enzyme n=1 Tax=Blastococcus sp. TF02-8 TaxID=2250574 RepID=UPI00141312DC|nr:aminotransferase class V-fold PLP-dependent enzyme [Blastococcus sp. TF02-8]